VKYFQNDFIKFLSQLERNNNREWFNENKERYLNCVKLPFEVFIETVLNKIKEVDDSINISPKEAIFRIYKDVRFSKDKLPYKTHVSAIISEGGRKDFTSPGIYLELSKNGLSFYGGAHFIEKNQLQNLREFIAENLVEFQKLITEKKFKTNFGNILGEQHKRIPKEFKELHKVEPLIANKQFYYFTKFEKEKLFSKNLISIIMRLYGIGKPLNDFLKFGMQ
jgi:uncharacterized protein (TIGR02453 family)